LLLVVPAWGKRCETSSRSPTGFAIRSREDAPSPLRQRARDRRAGPGRREEGSDVVDLVLLEMDRLVERGTPLARAGGVEAIQLSSSPLRAFLVVFQTGDFAAPRPRALNEPS
jgi:hypothetical protein